MERNHRNTFGRSRVSPIVQRELVQGDSETYQISGRDSGTGHNGFPRKLLLNENLDYESTEGFTPHVITRMPNLTGYGHEATPQVLSLYRLNSGRLRNHLYILKKLRNLSVQKWCFILTIVAVIGMFGWSLFKGPVARQNVAKNITLEKTGKENQPPVNVLPQESAQTPLPRGFNEFALDGLDRATPLFNGTTPSQIPQYQNYGVQSFVPVDSTVPEMSQFSPSTTGTVMVMPDVPSRDLLPWERQPNNPTTVVMANNSFPSYSGAMEGAPQNPSQNPYPQEVYSFPPSNPIERMTSGMTATSPQQNSSVSQQLAGGFGAVPQQVSYQQPLANQNLAVAINTANIPSYPQGQGQWPQNPGNNYTPQSQQQPNPENSSQYATQPNVPQYNMQAVTQNNISNVPMVTSGQSYCDSFVTPASLPRAFNPYPGNSW